MAAQGSLKLLYRQPFRRNQIMRGIRNDHAAEQIES